MLDYQNWVMRPCQHSTKIKNCFWRKKIILNECLRFWWGISTKYYTVGWQILFKFKSNSCISMYTYDKFKFNSYVHINFKNLRFKKFSKSPIQLIQDKLFFKFKVSMAGWWIDILCVVNACVVSVNVVALCIVI